MSPVSVDELVLDLHFDAPIPGDDLSRLTIEGKEVATHPNNRPLAIISVEANETRVRLTLRPPRDGTIRASTLLKLNRSDELAGFLAEAAARQAAELKRPHGRVSLPALLVERTGEVILIGSELPALHALLVPPYADSADRWRMLAPEAGRGELEDPLSDVYALGALYYEMLSGVRYRAQLGSTEATLACLEDAPPELPGALEKVREPLLALLSNALSAERSDRPRELALAIRVEMRASGKTPCSHADVAKKVSRLNEPVNVLLGAEEAKGDVRPRFQKGVPLRVRPIEERVRQESDNERSVELNAPAVERARRSR